MITMIVPAAILRKDRIIQAHGSVEPFGSDHLICRFASKADADQFRGSYVNESECKASTTSVAAASTASVAATSAATSRASYSADASISATATRAGSATDAARPDLRSSSCGTSYATATSATSRSDDGFMAHLTLDGARLTGTLTGDFVLGQRRFMIGDEWHALPVAESYSITIPASHAPFALIRTIAILAKVKFSSGPRLVEDDKLFCVIRDPEEVIRFLTLVSA
ncbi:hypothetical protein HH800_06890 [Sphingobium yanoikuyae]|uniref:Uncharacterized protein n=1 Tax=Sphingobium yanoikuyae TaxID=13690 RepID=A0A6M4G4C2_SPHYA|nr:hypothetical protein [Sphingobium yanoikuyae]QJR01949.1 hypothetical protein HH800_06890 [Sphingobium yanoikuyae]